jgi:hypothetical protein
MLDASTIIHCACYARAIKRPRRLGPQRRSVTVDQEESDVLSGFIHAWTHSLMALGRWRDL